MCVSVCIHIPYVDMLPFTSTHCKYAITLAKLMQVITAFFPPQREKVSALMALLSAR